MPPAPAPGVATDQRVNQSRHGSQVSDASERLRCGQSDGEVAVIQQWDEAGGGLRAPCFQKGDGAEAVVHVEVAISQAAGPPPPCTGVYCIEPAN